MRDIEDADSGRVLAVLQEIGRRSRVVCLIIDLHRPHARPVDGKQQVVMGITEAEYTARFCHPVQTGWRLTRTARRKFELLEPQ